MTEPTTLPTQCSLARAEEMLKQYPYYTLGAILALKSAPIQSEQAVRLAERVAISLPDMEAFSRIFGSRAAIFDNFYPESSTPTSGTIDTIDTFLSTYGHGQGREVDALTKLIFSPVPDYAATLAAEERQSVPSATDAQDSSLSEQDRLINAFIAENHQPAEEKESDKLTNSSDQEKKSETAKAKPQKEADKGTLTESLLRVMLKNRNYTKAMEIISEINLNNPEKSVYFADQMRFLRKLIINENKK